MSETEKSVLLARAYRELEAERNDLAAAMMRLMATIDGGRRVWGDPVTDQVVTAVRECEAERMRLRALTQAVDGILRLCQNCHDDWLRAQDRLGVNLNGEAQ